MKEIKIVSIELAPGGITKGMTMRGKAFIQRIIYPAHLNPPKSI